MVLLCKAASLHQWTTTNNGDESQIRHGDRQVVFLIEMQSCGMDSLISRSRQPCWEHSKSHYSYLCITYLYTYMPLAIHVYMVEHENEMK